MSIDEEKEYEEHLFCYTSGRWLANESEKAEEHYTKFNVDALKEVAASAGGARSVTCITKLAEGGFNKILLLTLDNGREVIARIPMARKDNAEHIVTASDVATMEYVRTRLGVPVPPVLAWCADKSQTPVNAEYIIMEKATGTELNKVWPGLGSEQKKAVVDRWIEIEKALLRSTGNGHGSIFFASDIPNGFTSVDLFTDGVKETDFVVGPHVGPAFWAGERRDLDIDRGPWSDALSYMTAAAKREIAWISKFARLDPNRSSFYPPSFEPTAHVALLEKYLEVIPYLVPPNSQVTRPALVHHDSSQANLFISEGKLADGEIEITAVIDWSHMAMVPLFIAARWPKFANHPSPHGLPPDSNTDMEELSVNLGVSSSEDDMPNLPADTDLKKLHEYYGKACAEKNPEYFQAMSFKHHKLIHMMVDFSGRTWKDDLYASLQACLMYCSQNWADLAPGAPLPECLDFSQSDLERIRSDTDAWRSSAGKMALLRNALRVQDEDCWVHPDDFVRSAALNEELKKEVVQTGRSAEEKERLERDWPFKPQDRERQTFDTAKRR